MKLTLKVGREWFVDLINRLTKVAEDFNRTFETIPSELLATFIIRCGDIWRYKKYEENDEYYDITYFKCNEMIFRVWIEYYNIGTKIDEMFFKYHNPFARFVYSKIEEARKKKKKSVRLKRSAFDVYLGKYLDVFYDQPVPIGVIQGVSYVLYGISVLLPSEYKPLSRIFLHLIHTKRDKDVDIEVNEQGEVGIEDYYVEAWGISPEDLLIAVYNKRDEIERRLNPMVSAVNEMIKGAYVLILY
jgi:hypothetical protein